MTDPVRDALEREVLALKVTFTAKGVRREDGLTAAEVEAELAAQRKEEETA